MRKIAITYGVLGTVPELISEWFIPTTFRTSVVSRGSCVSIADTSGNLLFYAFTRASTGDSSTLVMNASHQIMQNGFSIIGKAWYDELIIVPNPGVPSSYYLFSGS